MDKDDDDDRGKAKGKDTDKDDDSECECEGETTITHRSRTIFRAASMLVGSPMVRTHPLTNVEYVSR